MRWDLSALCNYAIITPIIIQSDVRKTSKKATFFFTCQNVKIASDFQALGDSTMTKASLQICQINEQSTQDTVSHRASDSNVRVANNQSEQLVVNMGM